ncbi:MAG: tRNA guanosine(15) transglycosylase TgtA [Candidatus Helarchaeota archaeon]|nr:tRNA guanosine(15) transglycosylase TgtA [Candidatus Helarchaeota archaeon]
MQMFELLARDAAGRLGKLKTPHGTVLTPTLMPVYNPNIPLIPAEELENEFKIQMLITNAFIIYRTPELRDKATQGVHNLINFHKTIMTDSGAYQAWMYQMELPVNNRQIVQFEEILAPDIATILDVFTETNDHDVAHEGVEKTLKAARECIEIRKKSNILWAAPVQGGQFLDLLAYCAKELSLLDFQIHPLGTLAPALQTYNFKQVAETIVVTKQNLNPARPLHGFSIGHPIFFALAVAMGVDLFDSSAYALFAKDNRYLTVNGTFRFESLEEFPCVCPVCIKNTPQDLREMPTQQREYLLAKHNLYVTIEEIKRIHVALRENCLWELVQERVRAHPALIEALNLVLSKYPEFFLKYDPVIKKSGFFYTGPESLLRPEVKRHMKKIVETYAPPAETQILLLVPDLEDNFHPSSLFQQCSELVRQLPHKGIIHLCIYSPLFGIIPEDLKEIYPLSQHEYPRNYDSAMNHHAKLLFHQYLEKFRSHYKKIYLIRPQTYCDNQNQEKSLHFHPIDAIIEENTESITIFNTIEQLKNALEQSQ